MTTSWTSSKRRGLWPLLLAILALPLGGIGSFEAIFAPSKDPWPRWEAHDPQSTARIDHGAWDALLKAYVSRGPDGVNRFAYGSVAEDDRSRLAGYIESLGDVGISGYRRAEQRAFWINLYNALTVDLVLKHYPVRSIRDIDISPGFFADGPWGKKLIEVEATPLSLNDIEHRILRPFWDDPRIHYAVNCASLGCPDLQDHAFTADNSETLLERAARDYVNSPRGVWISKGKLGVSSIYAWFQEDFGGNDQGILRHLRGYAEPELRAALEAAERINEHAYDWTLNEAPPR